MSKILITSTYFYPYISGLSLYPYRLAKLLAKREHQITAFTFNHEPHLPQTEIKDGINIIRLKVHFKFTKGLINLFYPVYAWQQVRKHDLIFLNCPGPENFWPALFAKLMGKKILMLYHCDLQLTKPWYYYFASLFTNLTSFFCGWLSNTIINSSKEYATTSPVLKPFLNKTRYFYPLTEKPKLDKNYLKLLQQTYKQAYPIIGFVGRFSREKNLETLLLTLSQLKKTYPRLLFVCAGPYSTQVAGEAAYYRQINQQLDELAINYAVLGILTEQKLASFYKFLNLLVLPSNNRTEAFGMVQLEAMQQGTPVVATNSPGVAKTIRITQAGELFEANSSQQLTNKIKAVLRKYHKYQNQALGVREKLNLDLSKQRLIDLFKIQ